VTFSPKVRAWLVDVAERVASSFGEAVVAAIVAGALAKGVNATTAHVLLMAGLTAAAATLKGILAPLVKNSVSPASLAPAVQKKAPPSPSPSRTALRFSERYDVHNRVRMLPKPSGRKGGLLPSPRDDRDWQAKLPRPSAIPSSVNYGADVPWRMLLNDRIGDCYQAAFLHALEVLTGYTPTDADALAIYEQVTGYDPAKTRPDGSNPTDQGTYGRQLFDWARRVGLISSYAAVPANRGAVKAAIAAHKAVLCEWALPSGAETEGDVWTLPRRGRVAGSWGGHATVEVGYTPRHNLNVTWGEQGTVTPAFEDAYLQAAWVVEVAPGVDVAAIMAKVRAA
jgi:hypothetical protein